MDGHSAAWRPAAALRVVLFALGAVLVLGAVADLVGVLELFVGGAQLLAGFAFPVVPRSRAELEEKSNPSGGTLEGMSEAVPWVLYDTETYVSTTTTFLELFATAKTDRSLSNMTAAGQLTEPQFFEIYYAGCDVLEPVTSAATGAAGAWNDVQSLVMSGRGTWNMTLSDKRYGPFPLSFFHTSGGITGFGYNEAAAGTVKSEYANNSVPDGGFCFNGAVVIPPTTGFGVRLEWPAALTLVANRPIRGWLAGVLHRRIL